MSKSLGNEVPSGQKTSDNSAGRYSSKICLIIISDIWVAIDTSGKNDISDNNDWNCDRTSVDFRLKFWLR